MTTDTEKRKRRARAAAGGFALVFSLVALVLVTCLTAALFSMVSSASRATAIYVGRSQCRLAAQSAIEWAKLGVNAAFEKHTGKNTSTVRIGPKSSTAYTWFNASAGSRTIGTGSYTFTLPATTNLSGCTVEMCFGPSGQIANSSSAIVSLIARATCVNANGTVSDIALEERFRFGVSRSKVFDFAYFVNNYGWFQGSGCTANGDVRANGNMYLDTSCKVNGYVYAAPNEELGVQGYVQNYGRMDDRSAYQSSSKTSDRSRPMSPTYGENSPTEAGKKEWVGGYDYEAIAATAKANNTTAARERVKDADDGESAITMPWISDLSQYAEWAQEEKGTLSGGVRYTLDDDFNVVQANNATINAHYDGAGPSGNTALADRGALVIEGTKTNPIKVSGPVVIDSDVVIKGYVTGQGTIYSGRNIHIVGNIEYVNGPSWPHPDSNPDATAQQNSTRDLVSLAAKGNIVLGDSTQDTTFTRTLATYLTRDPYVQQYTCDASDADIGYPRAGESKFCGNYTATDGGSQVQITTEKVATGETTQQWVNSRWGGGHWETVPVYEEKKTCADSKTRRYYQSVVPNELINAIKSSSSITKIEGVLYNNHGIFGKIGACTVNGALICRNEGIQYENYLNINWDIRLREDSAEGIDNKAGLPVGASPPGVVSWHELPLDVAEKYLGMSTSRETDTP